MPNLTFLIAETNVDISDAKAIFLDYLDYLAGAVCGAIEKQDLDEEFSNFPAYYDFLCLAKIDGKTVGACGVKPIDSGICEIKRLFVRPEGRGLKLGERLTLLAMETAKTRQYKQMYLHSDPALSHALKIYEKLGFENTQRYYDYSDGCSLYMKKTL